MLSKINPTKTKSWQKLQDHFEKMNSVHMRDLFSDDKRFEKFSGRFENILVDYSKNIITDETKKLLIELANECDLKNSIDKMFSGEKINETENRAVLHTALRNFSTIPIMVDDIDIMPNIKAVRKKMQIFSNAVRSGEWRGYTGRKIKNIVNIGIGGSHLGPEMATEALKHYASNDIKVYFISNVDGTDIVETLKELDYEETLFLIASKTFTTQETMRNAYSAREWFLSNTENENAIKKHFVALSTNKLKVEEFGIDSDNMFEFWDFIGGRYSLFSAIGLSIALYIGYERFEEMLLGASSIDKHFRTTDFENNIPVLLALISIWYINFFKTESEAILPYEQYLHRFPAYLQQANMESNGKSVDRNGNMVNYSTAPVIWGESGTNGQHSFYQLIHQGTKIIPADFLVGKESLNKINNHHDILLSNFLGQTEALMKGKTIEEIKNSSPFKVFKGNQPTNSIIYDKLTPNVLGKLIAIYEHKIFVQGIIWNIYSFDQWGVEYGKELAKNIQDDMKNKSISNNHDSSTKGLFKYLSLFLIVGVFIFIACTPISSNYRTGFDKKVPEEKVEEMQTIEKFINKHYGAKYVLGASGPNSFDCSGFILALFKDVYKVNLPRTAMKQYYYGKHISKSELTYGDLVFFNTNGSGISHVGVYLKDGKFGHASTSRGVMISNLNDYYFKNKFVAARRILK